MAFTLTNFDYHPSLAQSSSTTMGERSGGWGTICLPRKGGGGSCTEANVKVKNALPDYFDALALFTRILYAQATFVCKWPEVIV
jgi:hypothetical protein